MTHRTRPERGDPTLIEPHPGRDATLVDRPTRTRTTVGFDRPRAGETLVEQTIAMPVATAPTVAMDEPAVTAQTVAMDQPVATAQTVAMSNPQRAATGRLRTILPDELLRHYRPQQNLNVSAGQADLVLAEDRASGEDVVVKLYRNAAQLDRKVLAKLYRADARHVVRLLEHGESGGEPWEVQEYCALGTLNDYRLGLGGRLSEQETRVVLRELAAAIAHIHRLGITHRDLKPANVLVRSTTPLNLVLTDFGVAAQQLHTVQLQTAVASWGWVAPEVYTKGAVASSIDWWALGAIVHQLLTGRHLLAGPDGKLPDDKIVRAMVVDGLYVTAGIDSARWRNLVDGLVSFHPQHRWGSAEVEAWLAGQDPVVVRTVPLSTQARPAPPNRQVKYVFNGQPVRTGVELVQAMRRDSELACRLLAGDIDPSLLAWLRAQPNRTEILDALAIEKTGGARLVRLQDLLDPDGQLEFMGRPLTVDEFHKVIRLADRWRPDAGEAVQRAHSWLAAVSREAILAAMAAVVDEPAASQWGEASAQLSKWRQQTRWVLAQITDPQLRRQVETDSQQLLASQYSVALGHMSPRRYLSAAGRTLKSRDTEGAPWAENLARLVTKPSADELGLLIPIESLIAEVTRLNTEHKSQYRAEFETGDAQALLPQRSASKQLRALQRREGLARRRARLPAQLFVRLGLSAAYLVMVGALLTTWTLDRSLPAALWALGQLCVGTIAVATFVDFVLDAPRGGLRALGAGTGGLVGLGGWVTALSTSELMLSHTFGLPLGVGIGWTAGAILNYAWARVPTPNPALQPSLRGLKRCIGLSRVPVVLSVPAAVTAVLSASCLGACQQLSVGFGPAAGLLPWLGADPLGLAHRPMVVVSMVVGALGLSIISPKLVAKSGRLGWAAVATSVVLSVLALIAVPDNPVTWLVVWLIQGPI